MLADYQNGDVVCMVVFIYKIPVNASTRRRKGFIPASRDIIILINPCSIEESRAIECLNRLENLIPENLLKEDFRRMTKKSASFVVLKGIGKINVPSANPSRDLLLSVKI